MTAPATTITRAHLLLQVDPGFAEQAAADLAALPGVREAVCTTGSYDVIAVVEVDSDAQFAAVLRQVRCAPGLCRLRICRA